MDMDIAVSGRKASCPSHGASLSRVEQGVGQLQEAAVSRSRTLGFQQPKRREGSPGLGAAIMEARDGYWSRFFPMSLVATGLGVRFDRNSPQWGSTGGSLFHVKSNASK